MKRTAIDMICQVTILAFCTLLSVSMIWGFALVLFLLLGTH